MTRNQVTEVTFLPWVSPLPNHVVNPASGQLRVLLERVQDERKIGIDHRAPDQGGLFQNIQRDDPADRGVVDVQLRCDRPDRPFIAVVKSLNFGDEVVFQSHGMSFS